MYPPNRQTPNSNSDDTRMQQAQRCILLKDRSKEFKGQRIFYDDGSFESDFLLLANLQDRSVDVGSLGGALDENSTAVNVYKVGSITKTKSFPPVTLIYIVIVPTALYRA